MEPDESTFTITYDTLPEIKVGDEVTVDIAGFQQTFIVTNIVDDENFTVRLKE
jgi:predicted RNA-binding protein with TRAM domain